MGAWKCWVGPEVRAANFGDSRRSRESSPLSQGAARAAGANGGVGAWLWGPRLATQTLRACPCAAWASRVAEPADKPGSVADSHSSRSRVTARLKQPTRKHRGPRHCFPIWPCSRWGLPCRPVARLAVRSYRTISPLPASRPAFRRGLNTCSDIRPASALKDRWRFAFCCTFRRLAPPRRYLAPCPVEPGLSSASAPIEMGR